MQQIAHHAQRELWCLISGQSRPFIIRISPTSYIYDLEELVLPKCRKRYLDLDLGNILLVKVRIAQASCSQVRLTPACCMHLAGQRELPRKPRCDFERQFQAGSLSRRL